MKIIISPAKKIKVPRGEVTGNHNPHFLTESIELIRVLQQKSHTDISQLMKLSDALTKLNVDRYQNWDCSGKPEMTTPAIFTFDGDVYRGFDVESLSEKELEYAQNNLMILSGLYGLLSPLDHIQAYRLEMGTKLENSEGPNLYHFWKNRITPYLNEQTNELLVNLASGEYFKSINLKQVKSKIITPIFKDFKNGKYKIISFYAKKARGVMARYIVQNEITTIEELIKFELNGYQYNQAESTETQPVFTRKES
ncbi:MAG: peroxide stress protein YaaA [Lentisphaeria bacterium]|nr:peroxide stress protein YaaA [Lentisphaeria bacterium]